MRIAAIIAFMAGSGLLSLALWANDLRPLAIASATIGAAYVTTFVASRWAQARTPLLFFHAALGAFAIFAGLRPVWVAVTLTAAIYGWDLAIIADRLADHSKDALRRFAVRYVAIGLVLASLGVGLAALSKARQFTFGFTPVLGLAAGSLLCSLLLLRLARSSLDVAKDASDNDDG